MKMNRAVVLGLLGALASSIAWAEHPLPTRSFRCDAWTPAERRVSRPSVCDDTGGYALITEAMTSRPELSFLSQVTPEQTVQDPALRDLILQAKFRLTSNMNAARFTFPSGITRIVFRGSYHAPQFTPNSVLTAQPGEDDPKRACMKDLVDRYDLQQIVNYDELDWPSAEVMTREERELFHFLNPTGTYWEFTPALGRTFQYKFREGRGETLEERKRDIMGMVAAIIHQIEGQPGTAGSVYIHCYGGHHRTGAVWGVMQKCLGQMEVEDVIAEYGCHLGYESPENPGGYHEDNVTLIREFPCELLNQR